MPATATHSGGATSNMAAPASGVSTAASLGAYRQDHKRQERKGDNRRDAPNLRHRTLLMPWHSLHIVTFNRSRVNSFDFDQYIFGIKTHTSIPLIRMRRISQASV
jgi:hypothetical protein